MRFVRLAGQFLGGIHEVVDAPFLQVRVVDLVDAVGDPVDDQCFGAVVPQRAVDGVVLRVDQLEDVLPVDAASL